MDDEGRACGIVMHDLFNLKLQVLKADAVVIATGGIGLIYKKSTNSTFCTGAANGRLYMQGMKYANGEFIQIHPTCIPGEDKMRLISESVGAKGADLGLWRFFEDDSVSQMDLEALRQDGRALVFPRRDVPRVWEFSAARYRFARGAACLRAGTGR